MRKTMSLTIAVALVAAAMAAPAASSAEAEVRQTEVCFTVHMPGDLTPYQVAGTVFHTGDLSEVSTALLLQHGAVAERSSWDGAWPHVKGARSLARELAQAGYGVFAIDRLGYARSPYDPYDGSGYGLTLYAYVEMTHEIVTQIREGTYRIMRAPCVAGSGVQAGRGAEKVVLGGFSMGAALIELYATRYHDIAGIVPLVFSNHGVSDEFWEHYRDTVVPSLVASDSTDMGFSDYEGCVRFLFHLDGARRRIVEQVCGPQYYGDLDRLNMRSPSGEVASGPGVSQDIKASVGLVGPTPVLLVFADRDALFPYKYGSPDVVSPEIEMWETRCNCPVSVYIQPDASHVSWFHDTAPEMFDAVIDWLDSLDL
ncbi:MAG: alpha/beta hydrolase [Actinobacteria bacterium]|nr:alpha/beta hydrolase [Actinomycetota bacterium]